LNPKPHQVIQTLKKDSDFSLVSNGTLSEILQSSGLGLRPHEVGQKGLKLLQNPKTKILFFIANSKTCGIF